MSLAMLNMKVPLLPIPVVVALAILVGLIQGGLNGLFVGVLRIPSIITTLGTMAMYRALVFLLSGGQWVSAHEMSENFKNIPHTPFLGISGIVWYTAMVVCLVGIFLTYSRWGRFVYAVGGNRTAARLVGISGSKVDGLVFLLSGAISGLAGLLYVTRYAAAQTDSALGYELQAVAACVIGGVSVSGGSGTILGVVLGAFFLGLLYNALTVVNLSPFYQMALQGFAILVAIVANTVVNQKNQKTMVAKRKLI